MAEDQNSTLGVKMLADHLVKVKLQYEEQINNMMVKVRNMEKQKDDMERLFTDLEEELEERRKEIFQMKRSSSAQYAMEERENWKALVNQQKQENDRLKKELQIYHERVELLQKQLEEKELRNKQSIEDDKAVMLIDNVQTIHSPDIQTEVSVVDNNQSNSVTVLNNSPSESQLEPSFQLQDDEALQAQNDKNNQLLADLCRMKLELQAAQKAIEESKEANAQLTDQFIRKVDAIEHDHQERENELLASIEALKLKLDLELERKWELMQELHEEEDEESQKGGLISYLWG